MDEAQEVHQVLEEAARDAKEAYEYNLDRKPSVRMSRAGLSIVQLFLEDILLPTLPRIKTVKERKRDWLLTQNMNIGIGHLYSKVVGKGLVRDFPDFEHYPEAKVSYVKDGYSIPGTCDHLLVSHKQKRIVVVECKAPNTKTKKESEAKVLAEGWGYPMQLALYIESLKQIYPDYQIEGLWSVWAKGANKSFTIGFPLDSEALATLAITRAKAYCELTNYFENKSVDKLMGELVRLNEEDPMPDKQIFYGNYSASCEFHFSPWSTYLLDDDGFLDLEPESISHKVLQYFVRVGMGKAKFDPSFLDNEKHYIA